MELCIWRLVGVARSYSELEMVRNDGTDAFDEPERRSRRMPRYHRPVLSIKFLSFNV